MKIIFTIIFFLSIKCFGQTDTSEEQAMKYLNDNFRYCESYTADLFYKQNALVKIKSVKIVNERLRIVEAKIFSSGMVDNDTTAEEIFIPFKAIKKISIVYDEFANQPSDGLMDIHYIIGKQHNHNYLYFNWDAKKDLKRGILDALNVLVTVNKAREDSKKRSH